MQAYEVHAYVNVYEIVGILAYYPPYLSPAQATLRAALAEIS
jgi:hypothetical protein